ncbi:hypothetical protein DFO62_1442 [Serratia fonticola]|nr:hypothetical protein DFO62_1442 [Serratia fonticola]
MDILLLGASSLYGFFIVMIFTVAICLGLIRQDNLECKWIIFTINTVCVVSLFFIFVCLCID